MPRTLYCPRLSDDVVRRLYQEAKLRGIPMTHLADELLRQSLPALVPMPLPATAAPHLRIVA